MVVLIKEFWPQIVRDFLFENFEKSDRFLFYLKISKNLIVFFIWKFRKIWLFFLFENFEKSDRFFCCWKFREKKSEIGGEYLFRNFPNKKKTIWFFENFQKKSGTIDLNFLVRFNTRKTKRDWRTRSQAKREFRRQTTVKFHKIALQVDLPPTNVSKLSYHARRSVGTLRIEQYASWNHLQVSERLYEHSRWAQTSLATPIVSCGPAVCSYFGTVHLRTLLSHQSNSTSGPGAR